MMAETKEMEKLPEGWKRVRLGEVIDESKLRNLNKGINTIFTISNKFGFVIQSEYFSHTLASEDTTKYKLVEQYYFAYNPARINVGSIALNETKLTGIISPMYVVFKTKDNLYPQYFKYHIQRKIFNNHVYLHVAGSVRESLNYSALEKFIFILPPYPEQRKIAEILETVDNAIEKTDKIIEKYKHIKQGLMQDLLTKGIDENGQIRSEKTHKFRDSPLGRIPEEWEVVRLGETIDIFDNQRIPLDSEYRATIKGNIPYCGATGVIDYIHDYIFDGEYVLIAEDGGKFNRFENTSYIMKGKFWANNHIHIVRGKNGILDNYFLTFIINYQDISYYISGSTREKLNQLVLRSIDIPLPPLSEQRHIAKILSQIDETIEKEQKYKEKLEEIKKGLMEDLLTGKIRVDYLIEGVNNINVKDINQEVKG